MIIRSEADVTEAVIAELARAPDARFREILSVAVRHLHAFVREARLTEAEFQQACACVARLGQATNASHNEVVLAAGSLGLSSLVCLLNNAGRDDGQRKLQPERPTFGEVMQPRDGVVVDTIAEAAPDKLHRLVKLEP